LQTEPEAQVVLEVQGARHEPSTQSLPVVHWVEVMHAGVGRGRHRLLEHISVEEQSLSEPQPRMQAPLMQ
jgi:hypothetical protein